MPNITKYFGFQDGRKLGFGGMHGIPMVASSPVRHESPIGMTPLEVQAYQPPWKALSDFALHTDLDRMDPNAPSFHHLVSQVIFQQPSPFLHLKKNTRNYYFIYL